MYIPVAAEDAVATSMHVCKGNAICWVWWFVECKSDGDCAIIWLLDFATSTVYILVVRTCGENRIMIWYNGWLNATKHIESIYFQQAHHTHTTFPNRISRTAHCEIAAKIYIYTYTYMTTCLGALRYQLLFSDTLWNTHCIVPAASKCPCPNRPRTTSGKLNTSSFGDCIVPDSNLILGFVW